MDIILDNLINELKRGTQVLAVLNSLNEGQYGYGLLENLNNKNINIEAGTLYPLLRRLEQQKLLISSWDMSEARPRKYYSISNYGTNVLEMLKKEWNKIVNDMNNVLGGINNG